jgi:hypothetical protein
MLFSLVRWQDSCADGRGNWDHDLLYWGIPPALRCSGWLLGLVSWDSAAALAPHHIDRPDNVSAAQHSRQGIAALRRQRVFTTAAYPAMGVLFGLVLLLFVAHRV